MSRHAVRVLLVHVGICPVGCFFRLRVGSEPSVEEGLGGAESEACNSSGYPVLFWLGDNGVVSTFSSRCGALWASRRRSKSFVTVLTLSSRAEPVGVLRGGAHLRGLFGVFSSWRESGQSLPPSIWLSTSSSSSFLGMSGDFLSQVASHSTSVHFFNPKVKLMKYIILAFRLCRPSARAVGSVGESGLIAKLLFCRSGEQQGNGRQRAHLCARHAQHKVQAQHHLNVCTTAHFLSTTDRHLLGVVAQRKARLWQPEEDTHTHTHTP